MMAALVTEALARGNDLAKESPGDERAATLAALEELKPRLAALVDTPAAKELLSETAPLASEPAFPCRKCGHPIVGQEQFCGGCGAPRSAYETPSMQSKVASQWHMEQELEKGATPPPQNGESGESEPLASSDPLHTRESPTSALEEVLPELFMAPEPPVGEPAASAAEDISHEESGDPLTPSLAMSSDSEVEEESSSPETALVKREPAANWTSAAAARAFLEQMSPQRSGALARFWNARRGDIYLAIAVILVAFAIRWGIWSNTSVSATGKPTAAAGMHHRPDPEADLPFFDRMLIRLGLAEAPPLPEYKGNPDTQVWIDLHTALYYCPGADLYGKTPKGRFTTQRSAQLDQFESATRKACD
jgi:hypothetical protein